MIPNVLTLLALAAGLSALRFALQERWELAVLAILVAAILDGLDGRIARILKGASRFGAELDSLSDFLCFGVAPAFTLYLWALSDAGRIGWALVLLLCICCALQAGALQHRHRRGGPAGLEPQVLHRRAVAGRRRPRAGADGPVVSDRLADPSAIRWWSACSC